MGGAQTAGEDNMSSVGPTVHRVRQPGESRGDVSGEFANRINSCLHTMFTRLNSRVDRYSSTCLAIGLIVANLEGIFLHAVDLEARVNAKP